MFILAKTEANTYTAHKVDGMSEEALKIVRLHASAGIDTHIVQDIDGAKDFFDKQGVEVVHTNGFDVSFEVEFSHIKAVNATIALKKILWLNPKK